LKALRVGRGLDRRDGVIVGSLDGLVMLVKVVEVFFLLAPFAETFFVVVIVVLGRLWFLNLRRGRLGCLRLRW